MTVSSIPRSYQFPFNSTQLTLFLTLSIPLQNNLPHKQSNTNQKIKQFYKLNIFFSLQLVMDTHRTKTTPQWTTSQSNRVSCRNQEVGMVDDKIGKKDFSYTKQKHQNTTKTKNNIQRVENIKVSLSWTATTPPRTKPKAKTPSSPSTPTLKT